MNGCNDDYFIKTIQCQKAYAEIFQYQYKTLTKNIYFPWLEKHFSLYKSFELPPLFDPEFLDFYYAYIRLDELRVFLKLENTARHALNHFQNINVNSEPQLLRWLLKYEEAFGDLTLFDNEDINFANPKENESFEVEGFSIAVADFIDIINFKFLSDKYYWKLLAKYKDLNNRDGLLPAQENGELTEELCLLSFHLHKRYTNLN